MTNLEKLEAAIRQALPELMELTEGCRIYYDGNVFTISNNITVDRKIIYNNLTKEHYLSDEYDIIGHPITILHLLRWFDLKASFDTNLFLVTLHTDGELQLLYSNAYVNNYQLDLTNPLLSQQSESVINELVKLI